MCELFGANLSEINNLNTYLKIFFSHGIYNPHGYGIKMFHPFVSEFKSPIPSNESSRLSRLLSNNYFNSSELIAHIRYMTHGKKKIENCHPFSINDKFGSEWCLAHNGYVQDNQLMSALKNVQVGETDSERILLYILEHVNVFYEEGIELNEHTTITLLKFLLNDISALGKVNLIIRNRNLMFIYSNRCGSLNFLKKKDGYIFSTKPLTKEHWKPFEENKLYVFKNGMML